MFSFGLSSITSKVCCYFEHVFFCWKRYSTKNIVVLILNHLAQQTNTYSKSAAETLKANSTVEIALLYYQLVACLRLCSSVFWCTMNIFCLLQCFCCYDVFFDVFIFNFKQISHLDLLLSIISFVLTAEEATRGVL